LLSEWEFNGTAARREHKLRAAEAQRLTAIELQEAMQYRRVLQ
jgi:hypothetical protein